MIATQFAVDATTSCKNVDKLCAKKWLNLIKWIAKSKYVTEEQLATLSPFQCWSSKFCTSYCLASNIGKGGKGE